MNEVKKWFAVDIVVDAEAAEAVESAFNSLDALGTEIDGMPNSKGESQTVTGFFDVLPDEQNVRTAVNESMNIYGHSDDVFKSIAIRTVEETDWLAEWKKYWKPAAVGPFIIAPPWESIDDAERHVIRIEPNMAFGTGTHETTQLCLQAIADNYRSGQTFFDVGTGTGILAIAAAKLATDNTEILAADTDPDSVKIAKENAILNGVEKRIEFVHGTISEDTPVHDLVCANLTIDVIVPILPLLLAKARKTLVLSGILLEQKEVIASELEKFQISNFRFEIAGEWIAVIISME